jgi:hypothetical protein
MVLLIIFIVILLIQINIIIRMYYSMNKDDVSLVFKIIHYILIVVNFFNIVILGFKLGYGIV